MNNKHSQQAQGQPRWLECALLLTLVVAGGLAMSANHADVDLWGHVRYGRDTLEHGLARYATYTYTAIEHPWTNHENLSEILMAKGVSAIGPSGLLIAKCALGLAVLLLFVWHARCYGTTLATSGLLVLVLAMNLGDHWVLRPQLLSYVFFCLLLLLLSHSFRGWQFENRMLGFDANRKPVHLGYDARRLRSLWLAPLLFFVWANSHGGFVAGFAIYAAYLGLRAVEALSCRGRPGWGVVRRFALMITVAGLATFLNPYGHRLHVWLLQSLATARPEITEWHPPALLELLSIPLWLAIGLFLVSLLASREKRDFTHLMVLSLILWQALSHQRHIPFFVMAFVFWMHPHIQSALQRFGFGSKEEPQPMPVGVRPSLAGGLVFALTLLALQWGERLRSIPVARDEFPVSAVQFIADRDIRGKAVVTYNWAQYVMAAFADDEDPQLSKILLGFDGRFRTCYPQRIIDQHFDLILGDLGPQFRNRNRQLSKVQPDKILDEAKPDIVLLRRSQGHSVAVMKSRQVEWVLLYQDELAQLWGRAARYDDAASPFYIPPDDRIVGDAPQKGQVSWPAWPAPLVRKPLARKPLARND